MTERNQRRPGQVTLAGWLVVGGSLAALVGAYERITTLHSIDTRESVHRMLSEPPLAGSGVALGTILDVLHALALITAVCATAAAILGWHVLRRHRGARLALSIIAVPLLLAGMAGAGFYSTIAALAVVLLWVPRARDWFDGVERTAPPAPPPAPPGHAPAPPQQSPSSTQSPPSYAAPPPQHRQPPPWPTGVVGPPAAHRRSERRPVAVVWAALLTWVFCALTIAVMVGSAIMITDDPGPVLREALRRNPELSGQGVTEHLLVVTMWTVTALAIAGCLAASVAAVLLWRRVALGRVLLLALVVPAGVVTLLMTLAAAPFVIGLGGSAATLALLLRPEVRAWLSRR